MSEHTFDFNAFIREVLLKKTLRKNMLKQRSRGIVSIDVSWKNHKLEMYDVILNDRKGELDYIKLEGKYPLTNVQKNIYEAYFDVPNGPPVRVVVRYIKGWVMVSTPGCSWSVYCQVGKVHD